MEAASPHVVWPERTYLLACLLLIGAGVVIQQTAPGGWALLTAGVVGLIWFVNFRRVLTRRRARSFGKELHKARADAHVFATGLLNLIYGLSDARESVIHTVEVETRVTRRELDGAPDSWVMRLFLNAIESLYGLIPDMENISDSELQAMQPELIGSSIKAMLAWNVLEQRGLLDHEPPILLPGYRFAPGGLS